jgi:hypothetical protein
MTVDMADRIADCLVKDHIALMNELRASQAREAKLREEVKEFMKMCDWPKDCMAREAQRGYVCALLGYELDDTALKEAIKQAKREALMEAANIIPRAVGQPGNDWGEGYTAATKDASKGLRRMAGELWCTSTP